MKLKSEFKLKFSDINLELFEILYVDEHMRIHTDKSQSKWYSASNITKKKPDATRKSILKWAVNLIENKRNLFEMLAYIWSKVKV